MTLRPLFRCLGALVLCCLAGTAFADSWGPASTKTEESPDGTFRFTVRPGGPWSDRRPDFEQATRHAERSAPAQIDPEAPPIGRLDIRTPGGWEPVWERPLVNAIMPLDWLVADTGKYVITWDNWLMAGMGPDALVVYGSGGRLVTSLSLEQFLPPGMVTTLPRSVSSIWWAGPHAFSADGSQVLIRVVVPGDERTTDKREHFTLMLDPATGQVQPVRDALWHKALAAAVAVRRREKQAAAEFVDPMSAPRRDSRLAWRNYAYEAFHRLGQDGQTTRPDVTVLRLPPDADAITDLRWIPGNLASAPVGSSLVFVSSAPDALADALVMSALRLRSGSLAGRRIVAFVPATDVGSVRLALGRLGAEAIVLPPDSPIPQSPERLHRWQALNAELSR